MVTPTDLVGAFARNTRLLARHCEGVSYAESLIQPPFNHNCLNWVLGHIIANRDDMLAHAGAPPALGQAGERYRRGTPPVTGDEEGVLTLEELLEALARGQETIAATLAALPPEQLASERRIGENAMTLGYLIFFYYFHDTYHTGQIDMLRQVSGKNDAIL